MQNSNAIDSFNGYYQFLNNDYSSWVMLDGILFPSLTTAYQASRTNDVNIRKQISQVEDYDSLKQIVMKIKNPNNWNSKRYKIMQKLVRDKFKRNKQIAARLLATKDRELLNKYPQDGDNQYYWGIVPNGNGHNNLGKILKTIRQQYQKGIDHERWVQHHNLQNDPLMFPKVSLIVQKEGSKIDKLFLQKKNVFYFGNSKENAFKLDHSSISKYHACIFFDNQLGVNLVDLNSTNGTFLDGVKINPLEPILLNKGSIIVFGTSTRKYIIQIDRKNVEQQIAKRQKQVQKSLNTIQTLKDTNNLSKEQIKSKIGYINNCLLISNLHQKTSHLQLKDQFSQYGYIKDVRMCIDRKTGKTQGNAIIYFNNSKDAQSIIIKRPKIELRGRILEIKLIDNYEAQNILSRYDIEKKQSKQKHRSRDQRQRQRTRDKHDKKW